MRLTTTTLAAAVVSGGLLAAVLGLGTATAIADAPPPPPPMGEVPPPWAPGKPAEHWAGQPVVWTSMWGGRWGVWINDGFITLSANPVTNGG
ncbi:MAG TPA: hypothetical protein PLI79_07590 [Mycobacterium sp.]|nr:hypothetical protein [Mycobacterium sp.]